MGVRGKIHGREYDRCVALIRHFHGPVTVEQHVSHHFIERFPIQTVDRFHRQAHEIAGQVADATADARIVTEIKAKYTADSDLSVWSISVSCHEGHVALSGTVPTSEGVGKAVALALEVNGVVDVTSTLDLKPK